MESLDFKFDMGITNLDPTLTKGENLLHFIGPLVTDFLRANLELPLTRVLASKSYEDVNLCAQLDDTKLS